MNNILLSGEIRQVKVLTSKKNNDKPFAQALAIEVEESFGNVALVEFNDFDLKKVYVVGQSLNQVPCFVKAFKDRVVFQPIKAEEPTKKEDKAKTSMKV